MSKSQQTQTLKNTVESLLKEADSKVQSQFFYSEVSDDDKWDEDCITDFKVKLKEKGITFKHEDNFGGEGQGDDYWSVYSFTDRDNFKVYVQFDGWYASYNGADYSEYFFVEPKEVTRVEFFKV